MKHFIVVCGKRRVTVEADYFKADGNGLLWFRNVAPSTQDYPQFVRCFAAGAWTEVRVKEDKREAQSQR